MNRSEQGDPGRRVRRRRQSGGALAVLALLAADLSGQSAPDRSLDDAEAPQAVAKRVADRWVAATRLELVGRLQRARQEGTYSIDFFDSLDPAADALYYARGLLVLDPEQPLPTATRLGVSHSAGDVEIRVAGEVVYRGSEEGEAEVERLDYGLLRFRSEAPLILSSDSEELSIRMAPASVEARIVIGFLDPASGRVSDRVELRAPKLENPPLDVPVLLIGPFAAAGRGLEARHPPDRSGVELGTAYPGLGGRSLRWDAPRVHLVSAIPEPLAYSDWRYFTGTLLDALDRVGRHFPDLDYRPFIDRHLDFFLGHRIGVANERRAYGEREGPFAHYYRFRLLDDVGMQGVPFVERLRRRRNPPAPPRPGPDLELVLRIARHLESGAERLADGTFTRLTPEPGTVWADDLFMGSVFLVRAASLLDRPRYLDDAARQAVAMHRYLYDPKTGLYRHGYSTARDTPSSSHWGRGNGWTMMAKTEILEALPADHPLRPQVLETFRQHAGGLVRVQSEDGRWHQVLDNPDTYLETSATAMFVRTFATGVVRGWLPVSPYAAAARRGWLALTTQIASDGSVEGIVPGTPILDSDQAYDRRLPRTDDPRGLGAILYASVAVDELETLRP